MTNIQWADETWNPTLGCSKVSPGCRECYAIRDAYRLSFNPNPRISAAYKGLTVLDGNNHPNWSGKVRLQTDRLLQPLHWRQPKRIFVDSMSDLFHESLPEGDIAEVFKAMNRAPWHTYMVLTKRAQRMFTLMPRLEATFGYMPNLQLGVSVEDPATAELRIGFLLRTSCAARFVSYEPALAAIDFKQWLSGSPKLDGLIAGGESGHRSRPPNVEWFRAARDHCAAAGVPFFFKQWGSFHPMASTDGEYGSPFGGHQMLRVGKKVAGRLLDGREWNGLPEAASASV